MNIAVFNNKRKMHLLGCIKLGARQSLERVEKGVEKFCTECFILFFWTAMRAVKEKSFVPNVFRQCSEQLKMIGWISALINYVCRSNNLLRCLWGGWGGGVDTF